jgi:uncharacterized protein (TIGR00369 family)
MDPNKAFFASDAWAKESGIDLMEVSTGKAKVRMKIEKKHLNSHDTVHGGAIFTLADTAFALASIPTAFLQLQSMPISRMSNQQLPEACMQKLQNPR